MSAAYAATVWSDNEVSDLAKESISQAGDSSGALPSTRAASEAAETADASGTRRRGYSFIGAPPSHRRGRRPALQAPPNLSLARLVTSAPLDSTGSNQPPASRTHPVRSRRARAIAASAIGRSRPTTIASSVRGSSRQAARMSASCPRERSRVIRRGAGSSAVEAEGDQHVVGTRHRSGAVAQQLVRAGRRPVADGAGHGHDVDGSLDRRLRRDQRAAALAALDDDQDLAQRGDDAVAQREAERLGRRARWPLGEQHAPRAHLGPQRSMHAGVGVVRAVADHGDRPASVDAERRRGAPRHRFPWPARTRRPHRPRRAPSPRSKAVSRPVWVALRVPTRPTRRPSSAVRSPRTNSTAGGCGSWRSTAGNSGSRAVTASMPIVAHRPAQSSGLRRVADARHAALTSGVIKRAVAGAGRARPAATA